MQRMHADAPAAQERDRTCCHWTVSSIENILEICFRGGCPKFAVKKYIHNSAYHLMHWSRIRQDIHCRRRRLLILWQRIKLLRRSLSHRALHASTSMIFAWQIHAVTPCFIVGHLESPSIRWTIPVSAQPLQNILPTIPYFLR